MTGQGGAASAALDITQERNTPMAKTDDTAELGDGTTPPVEPAAAPAPPAEAEHPLAAAVNDAALEPIKVRLTISPDIETELIGGETELLDLERQGLIYHDDEGNE
jgi:hypothetical protein